MTDTAPEKVIEHLAKMEWFLIGAISGCLLSTAIFMRVDYDHSDYWRDSYCYASKSEAQFCMDVLQERAEFDAWLIELGIMEDQTNDR